jgi:type IV pilus assembly protein PilQ
LQINQDKRSDIKVKDVPTIDTRSITTQVIVEHGQTVVLGGIYEHSKQERIEKVPFLGDIPLLGLLFRHKKEFDSRKELLIFVTPKIIK